MLAFFHPATVKVVILCFERCMHSMAGCTIFVHHDQWSSCDEEDDEVDHGDMEAVRMRWMLNENFTALHITLPYHISLLSYLIWLDTAMLPTV